MIVLDERIKKLLKVVTQEERLQITVLNNAEKANIAKYNKDQTSANLRNWQTATEALREALNVLTEKYDLNKEEIPDREFKNILAVVKYLQGEGWRISRSTLYNYRDEGIFPPNKNGKYTKSKVDKFALGKLKQKITGKTVNKEAEERNVRTAEMTDRLLEIRVKNAEHDLAVKEKKYVPRVDVDLELVSRAVYLYSALKGAFQSKVVEWINVVRGDSAMAPELLDLLEVELDDVFNVFAATDQLDVIFEEMDVC